MAQHPSQRQGGTARTAFFWILLNLLRLVGLGAIIWAVVTHIHLLVHDGQAIRADQADRFQLALRPDADRLASTTRNANLDTIITAPPNSIKITLTSSSASKPTSGNDVGFNAVPNINVAPAATTSDGLPVAIFPKPAPTTKQKRNQEDVTTPEAGQVEDKRTLPVADDDRVSDGRYLPRSTVPNEPWGGIFAIMSHLAWSAFLGILLLGQAGQPESFLLAHFPSLSMSSSPLWLGLGQMFAGLSLQTHFLVLHYRMPGLGLLCVGLINALVAIPLIIKHHRSKHTLLSNEATVYQQFNCAGRIFPSRPIPPINKGRLSKRRPSGFDRVEWANTANSMTALPEKKSKLEYPTFSGRTLTDSESQIPTMTLNDDGAIMQSSRQLHDIGEEDEDSRDLQGFVDSRQPEDIVLRQAPLHQAGSGRVDSIASANAELDEMYASQRLRVIGASPDPPQINVVSPSTIASSSRFADPRYRRPLTNHSGKPDSTHSSAASSRSEASSIIRKAVPKFPPPPQRPPSALAQVVTASDPRTDQYIQHASRRPSPQADRTETMQEEEDFDASRNSMEYVVPSPTAVIRQPVPVKGGLSRSTSDRSNQRTVRFDSRPDSTASGLSDYLPSRASPDNSDARNRAPSGHFSSFSAYTSRPSVVPIASSGKISLVSDSQYSSQRDMLPLLKDGPGRVRAASRGQGDILQALPVDASPPPSYRAVPGQAGRGNEQEGSSGSGGQWFSRWRSNR